MPQLLRYQGPFRDKEEGMAADVKIGRALISVTDKTGVVDFARALVDDFGVEIISTGGTAKAIEAAGVPVTPIEEFTGYPEMMDGRVKTLHPKVHGALLCRRDSEEHMAQASEHDIKMIDLVAVNLYEFEKTVASPDVTFADAIEHIDIGGPSMLRSAAKNNDSVTVVCDPSDYAMVLDEMHRHKGATTLGTRRRLAAKTYTRTAAYDTAISTWLNSYLAEEAPEAPASAALFRLRQSICISRRSRTFAMARTRIRPLPSIALPMSLATSPLRQIRSLAPSRSRASRSPITTCSTPMPLGMPCASLMGLLPSFSSIKIPAVLLSPRR